MPNGSDKRMSLRQRHAHRRHAPDPTASIELERDEAVKEFNRAALDVNSLKKTPEEHAANMLRLRKKIKDYNAVLRDLKRVKAVTTQSSVN